MIIKEVTLVVKYILDDIRFDFDLLDIMLHVMMMFIICFISYPIAIILDILLLPIELISYLIYKKKIIGGIKRNE